MELFYNSKKVFELYMSILLKKLIKSKMIIFIMPVTEQYYFIIWFYHKGMCYGYKKCENIMFG